MQKTGASGTLRWFHCSGKQKVSCACRSTTDCKKRRRVFLHTFKLENEAQTSVKKYRAVTSINSESTCKNSAHLDEKKKTDQKFDVE